MLVNKGAGVPKKGKIKHCLVRHEKYHNDCIYCNKVFLGSKGRQRLQAHMKLHYPQEIKLKKQYFCEFCTKDCKYRSNQTRHMKICKLRPLCE